MSKYSLEFIPTGIDPKHSVIHVESAIFEGEEVMSLWFKNASLGKKSWERYKQKINEEGGKYLLTFDEYTGSGILSIKGEFDIQKIEEAESRSETKSEQNKETMKFYQWLNQDETRKRNLPRWEELLSNELLAKELENNDDPSSTTFFFVLGFYRKRWNQEEKFIHYWEIFKNWLTASDNGYCKDGVYDKFVECLDELNLVRTKLSHWTKLLTKTNL